MILEVALIRCDFHRPVPQQRVLTWIGSDLELAALAMQPSIRRIGTYGLELVDPNVWGGKTDAPLIFASPKTRDRLFTSLRVRKNCSKFKVIKWIAVMLRGKKRPFHYCVLNTRLHKLISLRQN